jgi:hypothetical protein
MAGQVHPKLTDRQRGQFGPERDCDVLHTERHVYTTPFVYKNVEIGNFYEIDPVVGIELQADEGFIRIEEESPVVAVSVVGSGCVPKGYVICEWWGDGESIENLKNPLVKRQRADNLNGTHPGPHSMLMMGACPGMTFRDIDPEGARNAVECLKKLTNNFYEELHMGFYENTSHFRVGPPAPHRVTIRSGSYAAQDPGTARERYSGEYAVRLIETHVVRRSGR